MKKMKIKKGLSADRHGLSAVKKGFTLMELIVAMFIFVLVISSSSVVFASIFKSYGNIKGMKDDLENAQYAMNLMGKTLRTSTIVSSDEGNNSSIEVYDYSQGQCIKFEFNSSNIIKKTGGTDESSCSFSSNGDAITSGNVLGYFDIIKSDDGCLDDPQTVGMVKIVMTLQKGSAKTHMQTTVSLRDYKKSRINAWETSCP